MASPSRAEIDSFKLKHADKGDHELLMIAGGNVQKISALPSSSSPSQVAQAQLWLAEVTACSEIIEERKKEKKALEEAVENWRSSLKKQKERNILNLPAASSANGQLIAAILEDEDGLTAEEITGWCEELALLGLEECKKLLDQLVTEDILELGKDQKYYLLNICMTNLFPSGGNLTAWVQRNFARKPMADSDTGKLIIAILAYERAPLTEATLTSRIRGLGASDLASLTKDYSFLAGISDVSFALACDPVSVALRSLCRHRMVEKMDLNQHELYYFRMLGEK